MKRLISLALSFVMVISLFNGMTLSAFAAGETITATIQGEYVKMSEDQDVTIRINVNNLESPYCGFYIGSTTLPDGFAIKSFSTSYTTQPIESTDYNLSTGKLTYEEAEVLDEIPGDTYYDVVINVPAEAAGDYTIKFNNVEVGYDEGFETYVTDDEVAVTLTISEPTAPADDYEIWYELDKEDGTDGDKYHEYGIDDTVTASLYIKNNTNTAVSLQAYDIYLTYADELTLDGTFTLMEDEEYPVAVNMTDDGLHIQAIGSNTSTDENGVVKADININLPETGNEGNAVKLGTITFTIADTAVYDEELDITLTDNSQDQDEDSTNIGIANYLDGESGTTGNKNSYYPGVTGDVLGAEINTTYTVTYDANDGEWASGSAPTQTKYHNVAMTLNPGAEPTRVGYTFQGWSTDSGDNNTVNAGNTYTGNVDETFFAVWQKNTFTVTWLKQDGSELDKDENVAYGTALSIIAPTAPDKAATNEFTFTFAGWASTANQETGTPTADLGTVTADVTYYAAYSKTTNQYTVTFNTDGGAITGDASVTKDYNTTITLPSATKTGYTLEGWYDGEIKVGEADDSYTVTKTVELKAKWTAETYNVTLNTNGGTITDGKNVTTYTYGEGATLPTKDDMTLENYTFAGWYTNEELTGDPVTVITVTDIGQKEYWAKWTANSYSVTVDTSINSAEGSVTVANHDGESGTSANVNDTIDVSVTPNAGYEIDTVTYKADGATESTPIRISDGKGSFTMPAANVTVTATFKKVDLDVTKDDAIANGFVTVKDSDGTEITKAQVGDTINLTVTPESGYDVEAVSYTYIGADGEEVTETVTASEGAYSFTMPGYAVEVSATFNAIKYTITYKDGESTLSGLTPVEYTVEDTDITLPIPNKNGYDFKGWYTDSGFTGEAVTTLTTIDAENKTYYAKFDLVKYTITYMDGNEAMTNLTPVEYTVEDSTITLPDANKNGYEFKGWYVNSDFSDNAVTTITTSDAESKSYYAKFEAITYTLTLDADGGTISDSSWGASDDIYTRGYNILDTWELPTPTKTNYIFGGWKLDEETDGWKDGTYDGANTTEKTKVTGKWGNVTLTAVWDEAITYDLDEYKYAQSGYKMLRIQYKQTETNADLNYLFNGASMYYTTDSNYLYATGDTGVFYTLIESTYVGADGKLTEADMKLITTNTGARATIDYTSGDINGDNVTNIADANIVYQMIVNGGGYYTDLSAENRSDTESRLMADMHKESYDSSVARATIEDVNEIVNIINGVN